MRRTLLATVVVLAAGCGSSTASTTATPPPTTAAASAPSATVPSFGAPSSVLAPTAANATANASGACAHFDVLYLQAAQGTVMVPAAQAIMATVQQFAAAAAQGAPGQWDQLQSDADAVTAVTRQSAWLAALHQDNLAPVAALYVDCRPLQ